MDETEKVLKDHNLRVHNIHYIFNREGGIATADFVTAAMNFYYDKDDGTISVDPSLIIMGQTWWLTREFCDGHEGYMFHKFPKRPALACAEFRIPNTRDTEEYRTSKKLT